MPDKNKLLENVIEELREGLVKRFRPRCIILTGSFGRGGAEVIEEEGKPRFLSDCEVLVIPYKLRWIINRRELDEFIEEFHEKTGVKVEIWGFTQTLYLTLPFMRKRIRPTIANYDLKYGSKVIYGEDYLRLLPDFRPEDIPVWEEVKLILNRMAEALEYFPPKDPLLTVFWIDKLVLACQDALLLTKGKYDPSYKRRNEIFRSIWRDFGIPDVEELVELASSTTERRLGSLGDLPRPEKYWFRARRICDAILRHIVNIGYGIELSDWADFPEKYMSSKLKDYTSLPFNSALLQNLYRFAKKLLLRYELPNTRMMLRPLIKWDHLLYSHIPLVYFGLQDNYEVNSVYINKVKRLLKTLGITIKIEQYTFHGWELLKEVFVKCWRQLLL